MLVLLKRSIKNLLRATLCFFNKTHMYFSFHCFCQSFWWRLFFDHVCTYENRILRSIIERKLNELTQCFQEKVFMLTPRVTKKKKKVTLNPGIHTYIHRLKVKYFTKYKKQNYPSYRKDIFYSISFLKCFSKPNKLIS